MDSERHFTVARQAARSMAKLSPKADHVALIECAYVLAFHVLNALLHREGLSPDHEHLSSPTHSDLRADSLPPSLAGVWRACEALEALRFEHVWSPSRPAPKVERAIVCCIEVLTAEMDP
jgi:hypothetical protein